MLKRTYFILVFFLLSILVLSTKSSFASFTKNSSNPLLNIGQIGTWDDKVVSASNVAFDGTSYKMWYYGTRSDLNGSIGLATSNNGVTWTKNIPNPVLIKDPSDSSELEISSPSVLKVGNQYKMWYLSTTSYTQPGKEVFRIKYAVSTDGIIWSRQGYVLRKGNVTWESEGVANPSVLFIGGQYKMWYDARDSNGIWRIGYASSPEGITWTKYQNPVLQASISWEGPSVAANNVFYDGQKYHLYYHAGQIPLYIGHAVSTDGINWTKDPNPVLNRGGFGEFDRNMIASPDVLRVANKLKMYYSGHDGSTWRIGLAEEVLPVPYFSQSDPAWGSDEYDHAANWANANSRTISAVGCALTSAAMVLKHFNVQKTPGNTGTGLQAKDLNPGTLNEWMKSRNDSVFRNGATNWALISIMTNLSHDKDAQSPKLEYFSTTSSGLDGVLTNNLPAILDLDYPPSPSDTHFVVATKKQNTTYAINDPYYSDRTTLAPSYSIINRVGYYQLTNSDFSYLILAVDPEVSLTLKNSLGQTVGESFIQQPLADLNRGTASGGTPLRLLMYKAPPGDTYTLTVSSSTTRTYQLDGYMYDQSGGGGLETNTGIVGQQDSDTYIVGLNKISARDSTFSEKITPKTPANDAQSSYQLGWISNKGFYTKLVKDLKMVETLVSMRKTTPAKLLLTAILKSLDAVNGKLVTETAYQLLTKDISTLLTNL